MDITALPVAGQQDDDGFCAAAAGRRGSDFTQTVAAAAVLEALAAALDVPGFFSARMTEPQCRLRFLRYPHGANPAAVRPTDAPQKPTDAPQGEGPQGTGPVGGPAPVLSSAHTDYGAITLLATDGEPGLEVLLDGVWRPVVAPARSLIVQLGDMLARWTNDRYRSTPHRVVGTARRDRYSIPFFVNPDPATVVAGIPSCVTEDRPCRYEPVTAGEFLMSRIDSDTEPYI